MRISSLRFQKILLSLLLWLSTGICFATPLSTQIHRVLLQDENTNSQSYHLGILIENAQTGHVYYQKNANSLFIPASVQKLLTATAAMTYLQPDYQFKTSILISGITSNHTLHGNLYIKFSGDPTLTSEDLLNLLGSLSQKGIQHIAGHIYIDHSAYNHILYPPGSVWDDLSFAYGAPLDAIIINQNKFDLQLIPNKTIKPTLQTNLPQGLVTFHNHIITHNHYVKNCPLRIYSNALNQFTLYGCLNRHYGKQHIELAMRDLPLFATLTIKNILKQLKISYMHTITLHKAPINMQIIATHLSPPLTKIIHTMLQDSNNIMANTLLKKLAQRYYQQPGSWQQGIKAIEKILAKPTHINFDNNLFTDGSGLSRYNLLTPKQLAQTLFYVYHNQQTRRYLIPGLPVPGQKGTLIERLEHFRQKNRVQAKTGTMTGVSNLAGFIDTQHHGHIIAVFMFNGFVGRAHPFQHLTDQLCELLINEKKY